ncbi:MAG: hypothetical protein R3236_08595, partial [Phycisphaeraceae bacterium]|nr:hypothetical protein [Phycisphaeraceae bacterium]
MKWAAAAATTKPTTTARTGPLARHFVPGISMLVFQIEMAHPMVATMMATTMAMFKAIFLLPWGILSPISAR